MSRQTQRRGNKYQKKQAALEDALASFERLTLQEEGLRYERAYKVIQEQVGPGCALLSASCCVVCTSAVLLQRCSSPVLLQQPGSRSVLHSSSLYMRYTVLEDVGDAGCSKRYLHANPHPHTALPYGHGCALGTGVAFPPHQTTPQSQFYSIMRCLWLRLIVGRSTPIYSAC
jgi:hypothetical protein